MKNIEQLIKTARDHAENKEHAHSLLKFTSLQSGFTYLDTWGQEHTFIFNVENDELRILIVTVPLPDNYMDESNKMIYFDTISAKRNWKSDICMYIDDYCYRDDPVYCGNPAPYKIN